jgi:hypothetical protein
MTRRQFLAASTATAFAGCRDAPPPPPPPPTPTLSDEERARIAQEQQARRRFLADLEPFRASGGEHRITPPPPVDIAAAIPELKTQVKAAIRLHPRFGEEPPPDASKLGGRFLWPADDKWPRDPATLIPLAAVLQVRESDCSSKQIDFRAGCDTLQILWTPRDPVAGELTVQAFWRRAADVHTRKLLEPPTDEFAFPSYVPLPCRLHPEWVGELPDWETLRHTDLRPKMQEWKPPAEAGLEPSVYYSRFLASSHGTKLGGWPRAAGAAPACKTCQWPMDYMLTIDSTEWSPADALRWRPKQDPDDALGRRGACGLSFSGGYAVEVSICRRCDAWPVRALVVK